MKEKKTFSTISISVDEAELAYLRAKQQEGYGISTFIRAVLDREQKREQKKESTKREVEI